MASATVKATAMEMRRIGIAMATAMLTVMAMAMATATVTAMAVAMVTATAMVMVTAKAMVIEWQQLATVMVMGVPTA